MLFQNLLTNAIKFTDQGAVTLHLRPAVHPLESSKASGAGPMAGSGKETVEVPGKETIGVDNQSTVQLEPMTKPDDLKSARDGDRSVRFDLPLPSLPSLPMQRPISASDASLGVVSGTVNQFMQRSASDSFAQCRSSSFSPETDNGADHESKALLSLPAESTSAPTGTDSVPFPLPASVTVTSRSLASSHRDLHGSTNTSSTMNSLTEPYGQTPIMTNRALNAGSYEDKIMTPATAPQTETKTLSEGATVSGGIIKNTNDSASPPPTSASSVMSSESTSQRDLNAGSASSGFLDVEFIVVDSGCGISASAIPSLFLPYSQEKASIMRTRGGTGNDHTTQSQQRQTTIITLQKHHNHIQIRFQRLDNRSFVHSFIHSLIYPVIRLPCIRLCVCLCSYQVWVWRL